MSGATSSSLQGASRQGAVQGWSQLPAVAGGWRFIVLLMPLGRLLLVWLQRLAGLGTGNKRSIYPLRAHPGGVRWSRAEPAVVAPTWLRLLQPPPEGWMSPAATKEWGHPWGGSDIPRARRTLCGSRFLHLPALAPGSSAVGVPRQCPKLRRAELKPIAGREARYPKLLFHTQRVLESLPEAEQQ